MNGCNIVEQAILAVKDIIEIERFNKLRDMLKNGQIFCMCGQQLSKLQTHEVVGDGVIIDDVKHWVVLSCWYCGRVDSWRNVMSRHGI